MRGPDSDTQVYTHSSRKMNAQTLTLLCLVPKAILVNDIYFSSSGRIYSQHGFQHYKPNFHSVIKSKQTHTTSLIKLKLQKTQSKHI